MIGWQSLRLRDVMTHKPNGLLVRKNCIQLCMHSKTWRHHFYSAKIVGHAGTILIFVLYRQTVLDTSALQTKQMQVSVLLTKVQLVDNGRLRMIYYSKIEISTYRMPNKFACKFYVNVMMHPQLDIQRQRELWHLKSRCLQAKEKEFHSRLCS